MTSRDVRLQAAVIKNGEILILNVHIEDGRQFWLLPGGGREPADADEFAAVGREIREETGAEVVVERVLLELPAHPDDTIYRRYRTFACRLVPGADPAAGAHDGIATIQDVRWLALEDENSWGSEIAADRFLAPQLRAIHAALTGMNAQLTALAELDELLWRHGIPYWLFGGWAVDFHVGCATREHSDIDVAVWVHDHPRVAALLAGTGWQHSPDSDEDGYTCYRRGTVRLEVAFLARDADGVVYTPARAGRGEWPSGSFGDTIAVLLGVRARVVSRESLIADKSERRLDEETAAKDHADVMRLREGRERLSNPPLS
jgi:8-oxo-dGTP pyrophosphatase MutT (NUDIX family)